ncbi:Golgin subfamily A member 7 [Triplophysa tibetana]|uniref:Golgin subfamily A member 7 n=1 Tax=Triplophysa tibetana TaxID=1572043 RepID=A0A5A9N2G9_9TELE|nr:Golgin subfamily A member 7 [Triplophysa tibetana]
MAETHSLQDLRQAAVASKVFVQRDYTSGTICRFQTKFPAEMEGRIDKQQFEETMQTLNNLFAEAEKLGGRSYLEGCLACLTAYTIFLCMETHYEKVLKKIAKYIQEQNEKIYAPLGLLLTDPIERGLRVVSFSTWKMEVNGQCCWLPSFLNIYSCVVKSVVQFRMKSCWRLLFLRIEALAQDKIHQRVHVCNMVGLLDSEPASPSHDVLTLLLHM